MTTPTTRPNVLIICAAIAVILFSAVGVAKMMDWLPTSNAVDAIAESETSATPRPLPSVKTMQKPPKK